MLYYDRIDVSEVIDVNKKSIGIFWAKTLNFNHMYA